MKKLLAFLLARFPWTFSFFTEIPNTSVLNFGILDLGSKQWIRLSVLVIITDIRLKHLNFRSATNIRSCKGSFEPRDSTSNISECEEGRVFSLLDGSKRWRNLRNLVNQG